MTRRPEQRRGSTGRRAGGGVLLIAGLLALAGWVGGSTAAEAQEWLETTWARQVGDVASMRMSVEYAVGHLDVRPAEAGLLYEAQMRYDAERFEPVRRFSREDGTATVDLELGTGDGELDLDLDWSRPDLGLGQLNLEGFDGEPGRMELRLSRDVPTDLELAVGAAETELDLGGVALTRFRMATGASETRISFDEPNPVTMDELRVKAGASDFRMEGLGNARFETMRFEGGIGDLTLDFSGAWSADARATVKMGLGSLRLRLPSDLGVRLEKATVLTSFSAVGFEKVDGTYRTENWESAEHRLELEVDAAFGTIEVERLP